jgi:signal transduction histidine kinase
MEENLDTQRFCSAGTHTPLAAPTDLSAPEDGRTPPWGDVLLVIAFTTAVAVLCALFNVSELLRRWTAPWERIQLDELPAILLALALGLAWFARRRYQEARREIARRRDAETRASSALAHVRRLSQQHVNVQEQERRAIARELHDELGQYLQVVKLDAVGLRDDSEHNAESIGTRARAIIDNCNRIHEVLTNLLQHLSPVGLDELGLSAAVEHCVNTWQARLSGVKISLAASSDYNGIDEVSVLTAYRVVQEALTNVAKHANATDVRIVLERQHASGSTEGILVEVNDNGKGFDTGAPTRGLGLIGMRERVEGIGGFLGVESKTGHGARLVARIPASIAAPENSAWQV